MGQIVTYEERQQRSGRFFVVMTVTDYGDSVEVKLFHEGDGKYKGGLKEGQWIKVRGDLRFRQVLDGLGAHGPRRGAHSRGGAVG
jgi:DNA polymerase III alpha subunit (gram-positive type)